MLRRDLLLNCRSALGKFSRTAGGLGWVEARRGVCQGKGRQIG